MIGALRMANPVSSLRDFFAKEPMSAYLVVVAVFMNVWAWIIPRGNYRLPTRDPLGTAAAMSEMFKDVNHLYYFWNTTLALTLIIVGYSAYRVLAIGMTMLADRVDL
ncbi:MAG: hypothetical protein EOP10_21870 [Proteobacteria bacterium]|nr:MAG: hypothetical protein EOP10_21870 [Pseudomonadota bacterium]